MDPDTATGAPRKGASELATRTVASIVLIPLALVIAYLGGLVFAVFWTLAALGVLWEWSSLVDRPQRRLVVVVAGLAIAAAAALIVTARPAIALAVIVIGVAATAIVAKQPHRIWMAAGLFYAAMVAIPAIVLRSDPEFGFVAVIFLFAIVWSTDIFAYFTGRALGGPKLLPRVSPKKTWSGGIGGLLAAILAAVLVAKFAGLTDLIPIAMVAAMLSLAAQSGDFIESAVKRRFGAKDASHIIPGHGGLMDRLDGFLAAATVAALIGIWRGGFGRAASGLLIW